MRRRSRKHISCPAGGLARLVACRPCRRCTRRGACPLCRLPPLPLALFPAPIPPPPFPSGEGGDFLVFLCKGLRPLRPRGWMERGTGSTCVGGALRGACPAGRLPTLQPLYPPGGLPSLPPVAPAFSFAFCPHPPDPLPRWGRGRFFSFLMQGAPPLASPALDRLRHLQNLPSRRPAGGAVVLVACLPCRCGARRGACLLCRPPPLPLVYFPAPYPPSPLPRWGRGGTISIFRRGLRPRHPCIRPFAALTEPAKQVPSGRACPRRWRLSGR